MAHKLTSRSDQTVVASSYLQQNLTARTLTPNYVGSFIFASLANRIHQVNSRSLIGPGFAVFVYDKTR